MSSQRPYNIPPIIYSSLAFMIFWVIRSSIHSFVQQVTATDADSGDLGHLKYSLSGDGVAGKGGGENSAFAIDPRTGAIQLLRVRGG